MKNRVIYQKMNNKIIPFQPTGQWSLQDSDGFTGDFEIFKNGKIMIEGRSNWITHLVQSENPRIFPPQHDWFLAKSTFRGEGSWDYYRLTGDGLLEYHSFWKGGCYSTYYDLPHFCVSGTGQRY